MTDTNNTCGGTGVMTGPYIDGVVSVHYACPGCPDCQKTVKVTYKDVGKMPSVSYDFGDEPDCKEVTDE